MTQRCCSTNSATPLLRSALTCSMPPIRQVNSCYATVTSPTRSPHVRALTPRSSEPRSGAVNWTPKTASARSATLARPFQAGQVRFGPPPAASRRRIPARLSPGRQRRAVLVLRHPGRCGGARPRRTARRPPMRSHGTAAPAGRPRRRRERARSPSNARPDGRDSDASRLAVVGRSRTLASDRSCRRVRASSSLNCRW